MTALESARKYQINHRIPTEPPAATVARALIHPQTNELILEPRADGALQSPTETHTVTDSLAKDGLNISFPPGITVARADDSGEAIIDDGNAAKTIVIDGLGNFSAENLTTETPRCIRVRHASSNVTVHALDLTATDNAEVDAIVVGQSAGALYLNARKIIAQGSTAELGTGVFWENGQLEVTANRISGGAYGVWGKVDASPTGDMFVWAGEIEAFNPVYTNGTNTSAAMWVESFLIRDSGAEGSYSVAAFSGNKTYVHAQKLFGAIKAGQAGVGGGLLYVVADKISATRAGDSTHPNFYQAVHANVDAYIDVRHWDVNGQTGNSIKITAGTTRIRGMRLVGGANTLGIEITGGTLILEDCYINTAANVSTNPITKSGGTLILKNTILVAESTRDSIEAGSAQNVVAYASYANKAVDANVTVTITGGLTVDTDVV